MGPSRRSSTTPGEAMARPGTLLSDLGSREKALEVYEKALEIKPDHGDAWYNKGNALFAEKKQAFSRAAKKKISSLLTSQVSIEEKDKDRWGRTVGIVHTSTGENGNDEMVKAVFAWVYRRYCRSSFCSDWLDLESNARNRKLGLWKQRAIPPWEYRKRK